MKNIYIAEARYQYAVALAEELNLGMNCNDPNIRWHYVSRFEDFRSIELNKDNLLIVGRLLWKHENCGEVIQAIGCLHRRYGSIESAEQARVLHEDVLHTEALKQFINNFLKGQ